MDVAGFVRDDIPEDVLEERVARELPDGPERAEREPLPPAGRVLLASLRTASLSG